MRTLLTIALLLQALAIQANPLLPYRADYQVWRGDSELGSGYYQLERLADDHYRLGYQSQVGWLFLSDTRTETSEFQMASDLVRPTLYRMKRSGTGPDFKAWIRFDPEQGRIDAQYRDAKTRLPWSEPRFDPLSYQQQLRLDVAAGRTEMSYPVIYKAKEREYRYRVVGEDTLTLPFGTLETIKLERDRGEGSSRQTYLWLAKAHHLVMARLIQYKDGDVQAELKLTKLTFTTDPTLRASRP
ncbi:DUF3108 domain-containing protein [Ferrimonas sediminicola]|uniref:DUF3108 domain-containing protein n=1 Tax=Ferrimonas sediminicola TaxID=2569538 RepID=A0A4U1BGD6_9GAMM|nr:DUF3108 domain-containing protein [Ferrimonas sediminicola]TKB50241.1 DUF3108 domain-containing protein [Ferrimonas sediminicola]